MRIINAFLLCFGFLLLSNIVSAQRMPDYVHKFDEFYGSDWESTMARLDTFALELQNNPGANGVLIVYGGQRRRRGEAQAWSSCLKDYLLNRRGINPDHLVIVDGGYQENLTVEVWLTVDKIHLPTASPHIEPKDVKFKGRRISKWRKLCAV